MKKLTRRSRRTTRVTLLVMSAISLLCAVAAQPAVAAPAACKGCPDTIIDSGPSPQSTQTSATFTFHATNSRATFRCSLDGASASACTSPHSYGGLAVGPHTFTVTACVKASCDLSPASYSFQVQPPGSFPMTASCRQTSYVAGAQRAECSFSAPVPLSQATCTMRSGSGGFGPSPCASPVVYGVFDGTWTFTITGTDAAGNTGSATTTINIIHGDGAVEASCTPGTTSVTCDWIAGPDGPATCSLNGPVSSPQQPCTRPKMYAGLLPGPYTFQVCVSSGFGTNCRSVSFTIT